MVLTQSIKGNIVSIPSSGLESSSVGLWGTSQVVSFNVSVVFGGTSQAVSFDVPKMLYEI